MFTHTKANMKDRRYKLTIKQLEKIKSYKGTDTALNIAKKYQISRQRVQQIWTDYKKKDSYKKTLKYRTDEQYRQRVLEKKREYYQYKKTLKNDITKRNK